MGSGYRAAGHDPVLVIPGERFSDRETASGRVLTLPGVTLPGTGGYRVILGRRRLSRLLDALSPDRLEVSDRLTLRWTGQWAQARGIPAVMVSHESLAGLVAFLPAPPATRRWLARTLNERTARAYPTVVCTTSWAMAEFDQVGAVNARLVPLGVDLELFHPRRRAAEVRARFARPDQTLLIHCGRLSVEKRPGRSLEALLSLRSSGIDAVLVIVGDGPLRPQLARAAAGHPVHFGHYVADRAELATLLATADVMIAPGPIETFGLAALESMACGTPVVADAHSGLREVIGDSGAAVDNGAFADGIRRLLREPEARRRVRARTRAESFSWQRSVEGFLAIYLGAPTAAIDIDETAPAPY